VSGISFVLDVTNPAAQTWWRDKVAAFMAAYDLDGIKLDRGEEHLPETATPWANGRPGRENRNAYPTIQAKIHYDALLAAHPDRDYEQFHWPTAATRDPPQHHTHQPQPAPQHRPPGTRTSCTGPAPISASTGERGGRDDQGARVRCVCTHLNDVAYPIWAQTCARLCVRARAWGTRRST
jgi:hypothetical protein